MNKVAIDETAKKYWSEYFHTYGELWTRDIPRRLKSAALEKTAAKIEGAFSPMANSVADDGSLSVEAAFVGTIDGQQARGLATAVFDKSGNITTFEFCRVS